MPAPKPDSQPVEKQERISVFIDNNVWDFLFEQRIDLAAELPKDEFCLCITREAEFEIPPIPAEKREFKEFVEQTIRASSVKTDSFFGFADPSLPVEDQRVGGFGQGRWIRPEEADFIAQQKTKLGALRPATRLFKNEADISIAARSFHGVVLSLDSKNGPINTAYRQGGKVVFLRDFAASGKSLREFIRDKVL